ncbi:aspartic peptidase domain-containing protein [Absidia repens]|uniref:rhizopuspepsin n=1 Tax=Absidia repens TaxID=90262 RepID=A0A1X2HY05_9FUNG|nr:aspartic peptidase domain-containing protein [Absidia repens]
MYLCSIFIWCIFYFCQTVLAVNDGVHVLALKSYRGSSIPSTSSHVSGASKLISGDKNEANEDDTEVQPLPSNDSGPSSAILESDNNVLWYTTIVIGTDEGKQEFTVDVDTGSSDLFIPGSKCGSTCDGHTRYDPKLSPTSNNTEGNFTLSFADKSSVEGTIYTDSVSLGGLVAKNQSFGVGKVYSEGLKKKNFSPDGLLGLGFESLSHIKAPPLLDTLFNQGQIKKRVFGVRLSLAEADDEQGELTLGGYNEIHMAGEIAYASVTDPKFWQVKLDQVTVGKKVIASKRSFIVDTGSTLINADAVFVKKFYSRIKGAKKDANRLHWTLPCANIPTLVFTIARTKFTIDPSTFSPGRVSEGSDECYGGIVANVEPGNPWIVGGVFLSNVYTIFDVDQKRIGFTTLKDGQTDDQ